MSEDQACEVPLVEQLRSIPEDYRTVRAIQWSEDGRETGHQITPVGFLMHRAADEIERLSARPEGGEPVAWLVESPVRGRFVTLYKEQAYGVTGMFKDDKVTPLSQSPMNNGSIK